MQKSNVDLWPGPEQD